MVRFFFPTYQTTFTVQVVSRQKFGHNTRTEKRDQNLAVIGHATLQDTDNQCDAALTNLGEGKPGACAWMWRITSCQLAESGEKTAAC